VEPGSDAAKLINQYHAELSLIAAEVKDRMEVVVGRDGAFIFVGKPPKQFGLMWIEGGSIKNLKEVAEERNMDQKSMLALVDRMRRAYMRHNDESRYAAKIAEREMVVHPSEHFEHEMEEIMAAATH